MPVNALRSGPRRSRPWSWASRRCSGSMPLIPAVQARLSRRSRNWPARWWASELQRPVRHACLPQGVDYIRILPEIVLSVFGMIIMLLDPLLDEERSQKTLGSIASAGRARQPWLPPSYQAQYPGPGFWDMVRGRCFSVFFHFLVAAITAVVILTSFEYMAGTADSRRRILRADPVRRGGHEPDVVGGRTGADLHRAGNLFDLHLHSGGIPPAVPPSAANRRSSIFCWARLPPHSFFTAWR